MPCYLGILGEGYIDTFLPQCHSMGLILNHSSARTARKWDQTKQYSSPDHHEWFNWKFEKGLNTLAVQHGQAFKILQMLSIEQRWTVKTKKPETNQTKKGEKNPYPTDWPRLNGVITGIFWKVNMPESAVILDAWWLTNTTQPNPVQAVLHFCCIFSHRDTLCSFSSWLQLLIPSNLNYHRPLPFLTVQGFSYRALTGQQSQTRKNREASKHPADQRLAAIC